MTRWDRWRGPRGVLHEPGPTRRAVITGLGAALGLPLLPSLLPRGARAASVVDPPVIVVQVANGRLMDRWKPTDWRPRTPLPPTLAPFEPLRAKMNVISSTRNAPSMPIIMGSHARECASFLTCTAIPVEADGVITNGWSLDQRVAEARRERWSRPSVVTALGATATGSYCINYPCVFYETSSWRGDTPVPATLGPRDLLDALSSPSLTAAVSDRRAVWRSSVLDAVKADADVLTRRLDQADRHRLDEYLDGIRELERRLTLPPAVEPPATRLEFMQSEPEQAAALFDLLKFTLTSGTSSVINLTLSRPGAGFVWGSLGQTETHHALSHHGGDPTRIAQLAQLELEESKLVAGFLTALDAEPGLTEGRSLLDESVVLFGSGNSDGNDHSFEDLPIVLFGSAGGRIVTNQHLDKVRPLADVELTILQAAGVDATSHGDSWSAITSLLA